MVKFNRLVLKNHLTKKYKKMSWLNSFFYVIIFKSLEIPKKAKLSNESIILSYEENISYFRKSVNKKMDIVHF